MAPDQGKTSSVNALAIVAQNARETDQSNRHHDVQTPLSAGSDRRVRRPQTGLRFKPIRRSPMHHLHARKRCGLHHYRTLAASVVFPEARRDCSAARTSVKTDAVRKTVGMTDVSSLGKIDVQGPDAAEFLNRVYVNGFDTLAVGKARYGVMLRPDGIVVDDGTTSRITEHHYFVTTTTGGAGKVMTFLEYLLQTAWPELKVQLTSVTSQWAAVAVAGPRSRDLVATLVRDVDFDNAAFRSWGVRHGHVGSIPCPLSFASASRASWRMKSTHRQACGEGLWQTLGDAGLAPLVSSPYGVEALGVSAHREGACGRGGNRRTHDTRRYGAWRAWRARRSPTSAASLMQREGLVDGNRPQLVGLEAVERRHRASGRRDPLRARPAPGVTA